jgi:hypothetical protein
MAHARDEDAKARRWLAKALAEVPAYEPARALLGQLEQHGFPGACAV